MPENASNCITVVTSLSPNELVWIYINTDGELAVSKSPDGKKLYNIKIILSSGNRFWLCEANSYIRRKYNLMPMEEVKISVFNNVPYAEFCSSRASYSLVPLKSLIRSDLRMKLRKI
jgi:hypothetical protein